MPYIQKLDRDLLDREIGALAERLVALRHRDDSWNAGLLNYAITRLILRSCPLNGYSDMNQVLGVLEGVKLEFARRKLYPHEDRKIKEAGDVY